MDELFIITKHEDGGNWVYDKELNKNFHDDLKEMLNEKNS